MNRPLEQPQYLERLLAVAKANERGTALVFKSRGAWQSLSWGQLLQEIDGAAAGLAKLGVSPGGLVAVDGEVTSRLLIVAAAAKSLGAHLVAVPLAASQEELDAIIANPAVQLVIGHGRETVAEWQRFAGRHRPVPIVFDHVTPDSRSPGEGIVTYAELLALAPRHGWSDAPVTRSLRLPTGLAWFEETTDWPGALESVLDHWLQPGTAVALPESHIAAARDRAEIQPTVWLASSRALERQAKSFQERLPDAGRVTRKLVDNALSPGAAPWSRFIRWKLRRQLGLGRIAAVHLHLAPGQAISENITGFLLGLQVNAFIGEELLPVAGHRTVSARIASYPVAEGAR
ncbi:AMP-binding protein [Aestuariivirga sp.]|uniref:AMP-binding protein n=1 Tax=Aestuariivirga sp. TaxID=2650926 RepID=UPI003BAA7518